MNNLFSIEGKIALVTGGSRGIGEMIAAGFLANGAKVYISSRKAEVCDETANRLQEQYGGRMQLLARIWTEWKRDHTCKNTFSATNQDCGIREPLILVLLVIGN